MLLYPHQQYQNKLRSQEIVDNPAHNQRDSPPPTERERYNNFEIRRSFTVPRPCPGTMPDIYEFYKAVTRNLTELAESARSLARSNDIMQLEFVSEDISRHITVPVTDEENVILDAFLDFSDQLVQSNVELPSNTNMELILQVVKNPTGGSKRKAAKTLDCELTLHYITDNCNNQLCFAISFAHVSDPDLTDNQALVQGREWQHLAGLTEQTPVSFSDVGKFENILNRKNCVVSQNLS